MRPVRPATASPGRNLQYCSQAVFADPDRYCADLGRDPAEILPSSHVVYTGDPAETAANAATLGEPGVDLGVVYLPRRCRCPCWNRWRTSLPRWRLGPQAESRGGD
jgi:hypothetical protein